MSLKKKLENVWEKTTRYIENIDIKEKTLKMKEKTMDKIKGIDNPEHYEAPAQFELFQVPVANALPEIPNTLEKIEPFLLKDKEKVTDAYIRLLSLLRENETIIDAITATMKKIYLIVWTNQDRLLIVNKEHYKILSRDEMSIFQVLKTGPFGLVFSLNQYQFVGSEKSKIYLFIRKYCHEMTPTYSFTPYVSISETFNYYEQIKYEKLKKENDAVLENRKLCKLLEQKEFPLVSIYGTFLDQTYLLMLSTNQKLYFINQQEYAIIMPSNIQKIGILNKGVFTSEFYMDNYYFINSGPEDNLSLLIQCIKDQEKYKFVKNEFLKEQQILMTFPFMGATSYRTPNGDELVIDANESVFLIGHNHTQKMYQKDCFDHYELLLESSISKEDIWTSGKQYSNQNLISKEEAIQQYENAKVRIFIKTEEETVLEFPFLITKKINYDDFESIEKPSMEVTKSLIEQLDHLVEGTK